MNVFSVMKFSFLYFLIFAVIVAVLFLFLYGLPPADLGLTEAGADNTRMSVLGTVLMMGSFAVTFGVLMSIVFGLGALFYNLTSGAFGGINVSMRKANHLDTDLVTQIKTPLTDEPTCKERETRESDFD